MTPPRQPRNPWPIAITGVFILFFSGLVAFIVFATTHQVDLVRPDYYEQELQFQHQFERLKRTQQLSQPVTVAYDSSQQCIQIRLPPAQPGRISGRISLYRPSDARLDQELPLAVQADGAQRVDARKLRGGLWKVRLRWTVDGEEYYFDQPVVIRPAA
jgi:nitrogen fixation protein FixH